MLTIRGEQMLAFEVQFSERFVDRVQDHLMRVSPEACAAAGHDEVRRSITDGVVRARRYGFESEYDVARYIDLMYLLGADFDRDRAWPWVASILGDRDLDPEPRMDALYARVEQALKDGPSDA